MIRPMFAALRRSLTRWLDGPPDGAPVARLLEQVDFARQLGAVEGVMLLPHSFDVVEMATLVRGIECRGCAVVAYDWLTIRWQCWVEPVAIEGSALVGVDDLAPADRDAWLEAMEW